jgi:receptor protein-tyrosine kinase
MTVHELAVMVSRRWKLILGTVVLFALVAGVVSFLATPTYQSTARLFVTADVHGATDSYAASLFSQGRVKSYAALATSEPVMRKVIRRLDLDESTSEVADRIDSTVVTDTVLIELTASGDSARSAQRLAAAEADELSRYLGTVETASTRKQTGIKATVTDPASRPEAPVAPRTSLNLVVAVLLGLLVGTGVAVVLERLQDPDADPATPADEPDTAKDRSQLNGVPRQEEPVDAGSRS